MKIIKVCHLLLRYSVPKCLSALVPFFLPLCLCALVPLISSCSDSPGKPDEGITISGTVTLEGRTDYSGVQIRLFAPVDIDTALTNINDDFPIT